MTLRECIMAQNQGGGALRVSGGDVLIEDSLFEYNTALESAGGAVQATGGSLSAVRCTFRMNEATHGGAIAVLAQTATVSLVASELRSNSATDSAGALWVAAGEVTLANGTLLHGNSAVYSGASILVASGSSLEYHLPAPLGHWVLVDYGTDLATLQAGPYADYPYSCTPGVHGDSLEPEAQSGPGCAAACPAGTYCPSQSIHPTRCPVGAYCTVGSGAYLSCPTGKTTTDEGKTNPADCICEPSYYGRQVNGSLSCLACPIGADQRDCLPFLNGE